MGDIEKDFEIQLEALSQLDALRKEKEDLTTYRNTNLPAAVAKSRKSHLDNKGSLKSDLKKTTAYVKKIKSINSEGLQQCIRDSDSLNLTLYISEIVTAIAETSFKATDVPNMVLLCTSLHRRYEEFTTGLLGLLRSSLLSPDGDKDGKKKRIQIRFAIELFQAGIWNDIDFFSDLLRSLLGKSKGNKQQNVDLLGLGTYVKYGSEILLGFLPKRLLSIARAAGKTEADVAVKLFAPAGAATEMKQLVSEAFDQLSADLVKAHKDFRAKERRMEKDKLLHGSITEQKQLELDSVKKLFEKLHVTVIGLAECTDAVIPSLEEEREEADVTRGITVYDSGQSAAAAAAADGGLFGDPEAKAFYEDLPDLLSLVPLSVLGLTPEQAQELRDQWKAARDAAPEELSVTEADVYSVDVPAIAAAAAGEERDSPQDRGPLEDRGRPSSPTEEVADGQAAAVSEAAAGTEGVSSVEAPQIRLNALLQEKLPECVNKQKADEFSTSFCYINTKNARKRLIESILYVPRNRTEITANYARIVATLSRLFPGIVQPIVDALTKEFFGQIKFAKSIKSIDNRMKTIRYIAELIKFNVIPPILAFRMFRALMADFSSNNIDLVALLMESCGRYLYLLPHTHEHMKGVLDTMLRLRSAKNLDFRQQSLLEMAYFAVKPPERVVRETKVMTKVQQYVSHLILVRLNPRSSVVDVVIRSLRCLPWTSEEEKIEEHVLQACLHIVRKKYVHIPAVADCLSGLSRYYPNLIVRVVDIAHEEIQHGLEAPHKRDSQRLLGFVRLLGELYNFAVLSASVVYDLLYHVINFSHRIPKPGSTLSPLQELFVTQQQCNNTSGQGNLPLNLASVNAVTNFDPRVLSDIDPPTDAYRAQLICELLNTCGSYYVRGQAKERLARFLTYFQRYLLSKILIPMHIEFAVLDTFDFLEDEAKAAVAKSKTKTKSEGIVQEQVFERYDSMETVLAAIEALEQKPESQQPEGGEEEEEGSQQRERSDSLTGAVGATGEGGEEEEQGGEEDEGDGEEGDEDGEDEDEEDESRANAHAAMMLERMREAKEEEEEFEKAFRSVLQESFESAKGSVNIKGSSTDMNRMAIPAVLPKPKNVSLKFDDDDDAPSVQPAPIIKNGVAFKLMSRDGRGRVETRQLLVPEDIPMVGKILKAEAANRLEKQKIKEKVLQMESIAQEQEMTNVYLRGQGVGLLQGPGLLSGQPVSAPPQRLQQQHYTQDPPRQYLPRGPAVAAATAGAPHFPQQGAQSHGHQHHHHQQGYFQSQRPGQIQGPGPSEQPQQQQQGAVVIQGQNFSQQSRPEQRSRFGGTDTLDLDEFLAESSRAEMRRVGGQQQGPAPQGRQGGVGGQGGAAGGGGDGK